MRDCDICGTAFRPYRSNGRFCSRRCCRASSENARKSPCGVCGKLRNGGGAELCKKCESEKFHNTPRFCQCGGKWYCKGMCTKCYREANIEAARGRQNRYYARNRERILESLRPKYHGRYVAKREYYQVRYIENKASHNRRSHEWAARNPAKVLEYARQSYRRRRDKCLAAMHRRWFTLKASQREYTIFQSLQAIKETLNAN